MTTAATMTHTPPIERPWLPEMPECPQCGRPCNREHFAARETNRPTEFITYLYCDHCDRGYESLWVRRPEDRVFRVDSTLTHDGHNVGPFLRILESLTCVNA